MRVFGFIMSSTLAILTFLPKPAACGIPDVANSFFVPQRGSIGTPIEGTTALTSFRTCPNNDAWVGQLLSTRIKVVIRDVNGSPVPDIAAADICVQLNGGTQAQGFFGVGADSIIANATYNTDPLCPDVRCISADAPTDANGVTYITFAGAAPGSPGTGLRDPNRKWGHYDSELPVFALGFKLVGRLTTASPNGTYILRIKNLDTMEGLGTDIDEGVAVTAADFTAVVRNINVAGPISYWLDFDGNGTVGAGDLNLITNHLNHDCDTPNNP